MKPSVGRIVHFKHSAGDLPSAAIIVHVWNEECVNLAVFDGNGRLDAHSSSMYDETGTKPCSWSWPPRILVVAAESI